MLSLNNQNLQLAHLFIGLINGAAAIAIALSSDPELIQSPEQKIQTTKVSLVLGTQVGLKIDF